MTAKAAAQKVTESHHIRLNKQLWARLQKLGERMSAKAHGVRISKTAVVEKALETGLDVLGL